MPRFPFIVAIVAILIPLSLDAGEAPRYKLSSVAARVGENIEVATRIESRDAAGNPSVLSAPKVVVRDGQRASVEVGQPARGDEGAHDIEPGLRVDIISIKGQEKVLIVVQIVEKGATIWAESTSVNVVRQAAGAF